MNNLNRQIIMQPKSIVATVGTSAATGGMVTATAAGITTIATMSGGGGSSSGSSVQTVSSAVINENAEDVQYFPRSTNNPKKLLPVQGTASSPPTSHGDTVNVVFRAPVVSSSSNQSMRPPPPPPPKIKGHSEEPSSSIPDLGKFIH